MSDWGSVLENPLYEMYAPYSCSELYVVSTI